MQRFRGSFKTVCGVGAKLLQFLFEALWTLGAYNASKSNFYNFAAGVSVPGGWCLGH
jgi:hypothetical protein